MKRLAVLLVVLAAATVVGVAGSGYASVVRDPTETKPSHMGACHTAKVTPACRRGALADFDRARAKEGLGPMRLPSNFARLTVPEQILVLTDIDRTDRGLRPVLGLARALQPYAQAGANRGDDPRFPAWTRAGGANWASGANALMDEFLWMYDDGPGLNLDCPAAGSPGCWGHRHNILRRYPGPLLMGAGHGRRGDTQLFLGDDHHDRANLFTWAHERSYFH